MLLVDAVAPRQSLAPQDSSCSSGMAPVSEEAKRCFEDTGDLTGDGTQGRRRPGRRSLDTQRTRHHRRSESRDKGSFDPVSQNAFPIGHVSVYLILRHFGPMCNKCW